MKFASLMILGFCVSSTFNSVPSYFDVSLGKCDGMFSSEFVAITFNKSSSLFLEEIQTTSKMHCQWVCEREKHDCWMIEYLPSSCRLYKSDSFQIGNRDQVDFWKCAVPNCVQFPGRCRAYWVGYNKYQLVNDDNFPVRTVDDIFKSECQTLCERESMCGSVSFQCTDSTTCQYTKGKCVLRFGYLPLINRPHAPDVYHDSLSLRCCENHENAKKSIATDRIVGNDSKMLSGSWKIVKPNVSDFIQVQYLQFPCLDYEICVITCSKEPFCIAPIFVYGPVPICYLKIDPDIEHYPVFSSLTSVVARNEAIIWKWETDKEIFKPLIENVDNAHCICFRNLSSIEIRSKNCTRYKNLTISSNINLYLNNQTEITISQPIEMHDGINTYLVKSIDAIRFDICDKFMCKLYKEIMYNNDSQKYVSRDEWFAKPPLERASLSLPVEYVIILNTYKPNGRCFSKALCSSFVRDFQTFQIQRRNFSDIAYNFLIGEDGLIYTGRGWNVIGAHTKGYSTRSIGVGFIGWFEFAKPNLKSLVALRNLIEHGLQQNYIRKDFKLITHRHTRVSNIPGKDLLNIISAWGFMDLKESRDCPASEVVFISIITVFTIVAVLVIQLSLIFYCRYRRHQRACCKIVKGKLDLLGLNDEHDFGIGNDMEMEQIDIRKDWIYFCSENIKDSREQCQCFESVRALWLFCFIKRENIFTDKLLDLQNTLNCPNCTNIYPEKRSASSSSRSFILFHLQKRKLEIRKQFIMTLTKSKSCLCKYLSVKELPTMSHQRTVSNFVNFQQIHFKNIKIETGG